VINKVSEFHLTPEQVANYKPGMDLGEPDRVYIPESNVQKGSKDPVIVSASSQRVRQMRRAMDSSARKNRRFKLTKEEYLQLRLTGLSRDAVAEKSNVDISTLKRYLAGWGVGKTEIEAAVLKELLPFGDEDDDS
jgi:hypothetical protein